MFRPLMAHRQASYKKNKVLGFPFLNMGPYFTVCCYYYYYYYYYYSEYIF
jgi:hypothetical protein